MSFNHKQYSRKISKVSLARSLFVGGPIPRCHQDVVPSCINFLGIIQWFAVSSYLDTFAPHIFPSLSACVRSPANHRSFVCSLVAATSSIINFLFHLLSFVRSFAKSFLPLRHFLLIPNSSLLLLLRYAPIWRKSFPTFSHLKCMPLRFVHSRNLIVFSSWNIYHTRAFFVTKLHLRNGNSTMLHNTDITFSVQKLFSHRW